MIAGAAVLTKHEVLDLARRRGWRALSVILLQWAIIAAAAFAAVRLQTWWAYALGACVIATRQHALAVLMHDGAHWLLARRKRLNDLVSDLTLAFPLLVSTHLYRRHHLMHHRYLGAECAPNPSYQSCDPDFDTVSVGRSRLSWCLTFIGDLSGVNFVKTLDTASQFSVPGRLLAPRRLLEVMGRLHLALFVLFWASLAAILTLRGAWLSFLLLWALPQLTVLSLILRLRAVAEHVGCELPESDPLRATRTVTPGPLERFLFAPCGVNYHLEHHLYPGIPCYNLARLHRRLMRDERYRHRAHLTPGYLVGARSVLTEISPHWLAAEAGS
jgi:fatty acid desaturase